MQWKYNQRNNTLRGSKRIVNKFAYWPCLVEDKWVWLECYNSHQKYTWISYGVLVGNVFGWIEESRSLM